MKLYLLERNQGKRQEYDVANGFVVAAKTEEDARTIASNHAGDEGPKAWTDPTMSTCEEIAKRTTKGAGVVLLDFAAG